LARLTEIHRQHSPRRRFGEADQGEISQNSIWERDLEEGVGKGEGGKEMTPHEVHLTFSCHGTFTRHGVGVLPNDKCELTTNRNIQGPHGEGSALSLENSLGVVMLLVRLYWWHRR
jgi:hypothetical protein